MNEVELETIYFAVVDTYDDLTGEPILNQAELLLDEDTYYNFLSYDDDEHVYIHWSEKFEVLQIKPNEYLLVNYEDMDGVVNKDLYSRFRTKDLGNVEEFSEWVNKGEVGTSLKEREEERLQFLNRLLYITNEVDVLKDSLLRGESGERQHTYVMNLLHDLVDSFTEDEIAKVN